MAFDDYLSVLNSDLYDHKGIAKSLLSRIYMLVPRASAFNEDGSDATPVENEGFCTASQDYLARQLGVDPGTVSELVQRFYRDGWVRIEEYTDKFGHPRYKYEVTLEVLKKVKSREMKKDASGEFVRRKCVKKVRPNSYKKKVEALLNGTMPSSPCQPHGDPIPDPSLHGAAKLDGTVPGSSMARCGVPHGTVPDEGLKLSSSVSKRGILPDTATDKPTDNANTKSNTQTLGSFAPEPRPGASRHPDPSVDVLASRPPVPPPPKPPVPLVDEELTALGHRFIVGDNKCEDCHWSAQTIRQRELTCTELQKRNEDNRREEQMEKARRAFL